MLNFLGKKTKKNSILFASFQIYVYICTKNATPFRGSNEKLRERKKYQHLVFFINLNFLIV